MFCSEIITFNTIKEKGALRDVGRALGIELSVINDICKSIDAEESLENYKKEYPELFKYKDIVYNTIVSIGSHPAGTVVSPIDLEENIGTLTLKTTDKPVSMLNMVELDSLFYVKMDVLGLDNVGLINETCKLAGIERLIPENTDIDDEKVWKAIREDTTLVFQWSSQSGQAYIKQLFSDETIEKIKAKYEEMGMKFNYIDLFSIGNGAIRPGGASYRESLAQGNFYDNKHEGINKMLAPTLGRLVYQEQVLEFLNKFCGFSLGESDIIRRGIAKKKGVEKFIPDIKQRFIDYTTKNDGITVELANQIVESFLQVILDSSDYLFSLNHSDSYSYIGYMCGYLREYYPLEFICTALNQSKTDLEKTKDIVSYAKKRGIKIDSPIFSKSKAEYFFDKDSSTIYKGVESVKFLNDTIANDLYELSQNNKCECFADILKLINENEVKYNTRHLEVLIQIRYFRQFGGTKKLLYLYRLFKELSSKKTFKKESFTGTNFMLLEKYSKTQTKKLFKDLDVYGLVKEIELSMQNIEYPSLIIAKNEIMFTGACTYVDSTLKDHCIVIDIMKKYPYEMTVYNICNGNIEKYKVTKKILEQHPIEPFDAIKTLGVIQRQKRRLVNDKWIFVNEYNTYLQYYRINV